jgi:hypothetical protein
MMASGEIRLLSMTMRQMPVLAQSQDSALNPNYFSVQGALNGPVFNDNTQILQNTGASGALNSNYFSVAAITDTMSEMGAAINAAASFVESWSSSLSVGEFAHNFGIAGTAFTTITDITSAASGGITPAQAGLNLGVGVATIVSGPLLVLPAAQFYLFNSVTSHYYPGGTQQAWTDVGTSLSNMSQNGLGP